DTNPRVSHGELVGELAGAIGGVVIGNQDVGGRDNLVDRFDDDWQVVVLVVGGQRDEQAADRWGNALVRCRRLRTSQAVGVGRVGRGTPHGRLVGQKFLHPGRLRVYPGEELGGVSIHLWGA